jgi:hypothetical protein
MLYLLNRYHYNLNNPSKSEALGDAVFKLKDAGLTSEPVSRTVKLISPKDGKQKGEVFFFSVWLFNIFTMVCRWKSLCPWKAHRAPTVCKSTVSMSSSAGNR